MAMTPTEAIVSSNDPPDLPLSRNITVVDH